VQKDQKKQHAKGCYEKLITKAKTTQVKLLNRNCAKTLLMSIPKGSRQVQDKSRKKEGDFYVYDNEMVSQAGVGIDWRN
jgi:uncharacterized iron-regulated protein